jgi:hypothetical protein
MCIASRRLGRVALLLLFVLQSGSFVVAQISPAEITNPRLKEPEQAYFHQLLPLNRAIERMSFPFPFSLRRYIGLGPKNPLGTDTRGLEFVLFHNRVVLKITGDYNAAFDSALLTQNQQARRVFNGVVLPILGLLPQYFSSSANFDGFGIEIAYDVRTQTHAYRYEGAEILTMVLSKADALDYPRVRDEAQRQRILDESEIYLDDKRFGLALDGSEPYPLEALEGSRHAEPLPLSEDNEPRPSVGANSIPGDIESGSSASATKKTVSSASDSSRSLRALIEDMPIGPPTLPAAVAANADETGLQVTPNETGPGQADLDALQNKYSQQFEALAKEGIARYHLVSYAPPSLVTFRHQIYLQLTLRNPTPFDRSTTSIYKRAAQDFDLFLVPMLKPILDKVPGDKRMTGLDISVLDQFGAQARETSEAIEFLCPLPLLRQFANAEVTSQDVINHTVVLVNGMRIGLDLQRVE